MQPGSISSGWSRLPRREGFAQAAERHPLATDQAYLFQNQQLAVTLDAARETNRNRTHPQISRRRHRKFACASSEFCLLPDALRMPGPRSGQLSRKANTSFTFFDSDFLIGNLNPQSIENSR